MNQDDLFGALTPCQPTGVSFNNLVFGVDDDQGGCWWLENIKNWEDMTLDGSTPSLSWADGGYYTRQWVKPFAFDIHATLIAPFGNKNNLVERIEYVRRNLPVREPVEVHVQGLGAAFVVYARVEDKFVVSRINNDSCAADITIPMVAADPRRFIADPDTGEANWKQVSTGLPSTSGGLTLPFTVPFVIASEQSSGRLVFTVGGYRQPRSVIRIFGPVTRPRINDSVSGVTVFNVNLTEDDFLEVRPDEHQVLLNGSSSRRASMVGPWPSVDPGQHTLTFTHAGSYNDEARIEINYLEAY